MKSRKQTFTGSGCSAELEHFSSMLGPHIKSLALQEKKKHVFTVKFVLQYEEILLGYVAKYSRAIGTAW